MAQTGRGQATDHREQRTSNMVEVLLNFRRRRRGQADVGQLGGYQTFVSFIGSLEV